MKRVSIYLHSRLLMLIKEKNEKELLVNTGVSMRKMSAE
jgi:hypothetical protein